MSLITSAVKFMENGAKYRVVLKGKQIEALPVNLKVLTQNIEKPVVHLGVNGRGAEGSMYGIKVFAKGSKEPVAAAAGRIDYREVDPLLQVKGFVRKNTGTGDALRANVKLNTNKPFDLENMDEFTVSNLKGGNVSIKAKSEFLDADIKGNNIEEIIDLMGGAKIMEKCRAIRVEALAKARQKIAYGLERLNPFKKSGIGSFEKTAAKVKDASVENSDDILAYATKNSAKLKEQKIKDIRKDIEYMRQEADKVRNMFSRATSEEEKIKLSTAYSEIVEKIQANEKYIDDCLI